MSINKSLFKKYNPNILPIPKASIPIRIANHLYLIPYTNSITIIIEKNIKIIPVSGSKNIQWDSRGVIVDGAIEDYPNVAGQQDASFEGWKVVSVSDDLIKVEPVIDSEESKTISIVIKLRNK